MNRLALVLTLALATPTLAQTPDSGSKESPTISVSSGRMFFGRIVEEYSHHVRLGNMGQDTYYSVGLDSPYRGRLGVQAEIIFAPTYLIVWEHRDGDQEGWLARANSTKARDLKGNASEPILWSCIAAGPRWQLTSWAKASGGLGLCGISGARIFYFGAAPMTELSGQLRLEAATSLTDRLDIAAECGSYPSPITRYGYTVLQAAAGARDAGKLRAKGIWRLTSHCGVRFSLKVD